MPVLGGDLGAMGLLAGRFKTAGDEFNAKATDIVGRVGDALTAFTSQMGTLERQATDLALEIDGEMKRLAQQASATAWTGENRKKQDAVIAALDDDIVAVRAAIQSFIEEANGVVKGALTTTMTGMQDRVGKAGTSAQTSSSSFGSSVTAQQGKFNAVMNG